MTGDHIDATAVARLYQRCNDVTDLRVGRNSAGGAMDITGYRNA